MVFKLEPLPDEKEKESTANLDDLGDILTDEIPEPQQHAIDQAKADAAEADPALGAVELDALGIPWDPSQHATGADGKGVKTAKGTWRKRRGIKGSASHLNTDAAAKAGADSAQKEDPSVAEQRTHEHQCRMAGAMAGTMLVRLSAAVGGTAFLPRDIVVPGGLKYNEEQFLQTAFGDYFVAKGIVDIPPGMVLVSALSMYYLPRFQQPEVREKGSRFVRWVKDKCEWVYFKFKYRGKVPPKREKPTDRDGVFPDSVSSIRRREATANDV